MVTKPEEAYQIAEKFRQYIQSPVLTGIAINNKGFDAYDIEPANIPDMFAHRPVIVFGKYRNKADGVIEVTGQSGSGEYMQSINVSEAKPLETNHALRYLWARTRISQLSDFNFNNNDENKKEVTSLGISYNLLTANTSFVAVHEVVVNPDGQCEDVNQPLPLPENVSNLAVGGDMASVPEPDILMLIIAFAFLAGAAAVFKKRQIKNRIIQNIKSNNIG